jgi:hypothetical protein
MTKFNVLGVRPATTSPVTTEATPGGLTHEGAPGYARDEKSELFLLAVSNLVGEDAFYESASRRDTRFRELVRAVAVTDPVWVFQLLRWLRADADLRSAPLVGAVEFIRARRERPDLGSVPAYEVPGLSDDRGLARALVDAVLRRADEPGELLAYYVVSYGRNLPQPVKRGVTDAVRRLYTERALLKYDTTSHAFRFGDVVELTHPRPTAPWQGELFKYALDRRHGHDNAVPKLLTTVRRNAELRSLVAESSISGLLDVETLAAAGMTWENVLSLAGDRLPKNLLWEALAPSMGYMALLRNLRNLDEAGVRDAVAQTVAARLADPIEVARSRQLPLRLLAAHRAAPSLRWAYPLERALNYCLANVPRLTGRTLILVDTSSSMDEQFSHNSTLKRWDVAVIFGAALAGRAKSADLVSFSSAARVWGDAHGAHTKTFALRDGESLLTTLSRWASDGFFLGGGTATAAALRQHHAGHDRVIIITDEQAAADATHVEVSAVVPTTTPLYTWNLAGYERGHAPAGSHNRHTFGGLTDAAFTLIPLLEAGRDAHWPWL